MRKRTNTAWPYSRAASYIYPHMRMVRADGMLYQDWRLLGWPDLVAATAINMLAS